jgi:hypothetical protein
MAVRGLKGVKWSKSVKKCSLFLYLGFVILVLFSVKKCSLFLYVVLGF